MPLRSAILRACSISMAGKRMGNGTLRCLLSLWTRAEPAILVAADFRLTYSRPARLAHQSASTLSLLNLGIAEVLLAMAFTLLPCVSGNIRASVRHPDRKP